MPDAAGAVLVPFTAQTRMSGMDFADGRSVRKGAADSVRRLVVEEGGDVPLELGPIVDGISREGATPLVVIDRVGSAPPRILGVIRLKDTVKPGMTERFDELRAMGIRTIMVTGDNPLTAAAIAAEAGVDDFLAEATPEDKMALIKREQEGGRLIAMTGDGTNDAPALAQADVGVAMNTGTQAAKEAGNMVDLDSNPTKLIEIVEIGKQLLITRGSLTTFSIANDVAKYFAIIPAMFAGVLPALNKLNIMDLQTPRSAILSAVIFNAIIIVAADPARPARREVRGRERLGRAAPQPPDLRPRRHRRPVHRDQAHRHRHQRVGSEVMRTFVRQLTPAILAVVVFTVLCGLVYPLVVTGVGQTAFHDQANGSLVKIDGQVVGSKLLGQSFTDAKYFHPRPSAAGDGLRRSGEQRIQPRPDQPRLPLHRRRAGRRLPQGERPRRRSGGPRRRRHRVGLGPRSRHLRRQRQACRRARVADARGMSVDDVVAEVSKHTTVRQWGFLGEPRVNVLELNLALDRL